VDLHRIVEVSPRKSLRFGREVLLDQADLHGVTRRHRADGLESAIGSDSNTCFVLLKSNGITSAPLAATSACRSGEVPGRDPHAVRFPPTPTR
jgi:hypothetical protein